MINSLVSVPAFAALRLLFLPATVWLAAKNEKRWGYGITRHAPLPPALKHVLGFLLLDYTNYWWHVLLHRSPGLWRFHEVHHSDVDLDVATALRFHFGELLASIFYRGAAALVTGASPRLLLIYEIAFEGATQFHHSNWRLPPRFEHALRRILVSPRMHGIHHSVIKDERDRNFSVIFSWWDRLHATMRTDVPQESITIGLPGYRAPRELTVGVLLGLPFQSIAAAHHGSTISR